MSATVELNQLRKQIRNRKALGIGLILQFVILPFCGFIVVKILKLPATMGITLMVVTSSPGGSYSNWWCSLFNAELALSVTMTALSTLLSCVMLPANLVLYTHWTYSEAVVQSLDWFALFVELTVVIGGICFGLFASARAKKHGNEALFHRRANLCGNVAGIALITLSVSLNATGSETQASLWDQSAVFYIGVALPAILGLAIATAMATKADLEKPERVAVAVEACYQNTGIATSVAISMFSGDDEDLATAIGVPLYYGIVEAVMLGVYCTVCWKRGWTKAAANENFFAMLWNSYEVEEQEAQQPDYAIEVVLGDRNDKDATLDLVLEQSEDGAVYVGANNGSTSTKKQTSQKPRSTGGELTDGSETNYDEINQNAAHRRWRSRQGSASSPTTITTSTSSTDGDEATQDSLHDREVEESEESRFKKATHLIKRRVQGYRQPPEEPKRRQRQVPSVLDEVEVPHAYEQTQPSHDADEGPPKQSDKTID